MYILVDRVENDKITFSVIAADIKCLWVKDNPGYLPNVFLLPLRQKIHLCTEIPINTKIIKISWNQAGKCITSKIIGFVVFWHTLNTSDKKLNISINHFWDCLNICVYSYNRYPCINYVIISLMSINYFSSQLMSPTMELAYAVTCLRRFRGDWLWLRCHFRSVFASRSV